MKKLAFALYLAGFYFSDLAWAFDSQTTVASEVCVTDEVGQAHCFLEETNSGRSSLYTTEQSLPALSLNEELSRLNVEFQILDTEDYEARLQVLRAPTIVISPSRVDILDFANSQACARGGSVYRFDGKCFVDVTGRAVLGAVAGYSLGPVGATIGGIGGAMYGFANSCIGGFRIYLHFENQVYDVTQSAANRHVILRCN